MGTSVTMFTDYNGHIKVYDGEELTYSGYDEAAAKAEYNRIETVYHDQYLQTDEYKNWAKENPEEAAKQEAEWKPRYAEENKQEEIKQEEQSTQQEQKQEQQEQQKQEEKKEEEKPKPNNQKPNEPESKIEKNVGQNGTLNHGQNFIDGKKSTTLSFSEKYAKPTYIAEIRFSKTNVIYLRQTDFDTAGDAQAFIDKHKALTNKLLGATKIWNESPPYLQEKPLGKTYDDVFKDEVIEFPTLYKLIHEETPEYSKNVEHTNDNWKGGSPVNRTGDETKSPGAVGNPQGLGPSDGTASSKPAGGDSSSSNDSQQNNSQESTSTEQQSNTQQSNSEQQSSEATEKVELTNLQGQSVSEVATPQIEVPEIAPVDTSTLNTIDEAQKTSLIKNIVNKASQLIDKIPTEVKDVVSNLASGAVQSLAAKGVDVALSVFNDNKTSITEELDKLTTSVESKMQQQQTQSSNEMKDSANSHLNSIGVMTQATVDKTTSKIDEGMNELTKHAEEGPEYMAKQTNALVNPISEQMNAQIAESSNNLQIQSDIMAQSIGTQEGKKMAAQFNKSIEDQAKKQYSTVKTNETAMKNMAFCEEQTLRLKIMSMTGINIPKDYCGSI